MLNSQNFNPNKSELLQAAKLHYKPPQEVARELQVKPRAVQNESAITWFMLEQKDGELKLQAVPNTVQVDVTSVSLHADEVAAPQELNFFGYKIDLKAKVEGFKENYLKNYALTKSHNLMVARFAEMKTAVYAYLLSLLGVASEDLRKLQKQAISDATKQNQILFAENEYNGELLAIIGGGGKKIARQQQRIIGEIRQQLVTQARNLGLADHYSAERVINVQIEQCQKILGKFQEEKNNLEYQLAYGGSN